MIVEKAFCTNHAISSANRAMIHSIRNRVILGPVHVQPNASKTACVGIHGDALKFRVAAPPLGGAANAELCRHLANVLSIPQRAVSVCSGRTSRRK